MTASAGAPGERLRQQQAAIAEELVRRQFAAHPEPSHRYGAAGRENASRMPTITSRTWPMR